MRGLGWLSAIPRQWKTPRTMFGFFTMELLIEIAALALFGIAQPDLYRTRLWQEGSDHGWNSNPNEIIYAYANYRPIHTPLPWSQFITNFNVVIAVVALFILLVKGIMFITKVWHPLLSAVVHAALIALFAVSIHGQAGSDMSDPEHPQPGAPWYITKSCGPPVSAANQGYCKQAKGAFAVSIMLWSVGSSSLIFYQVLLTLCLLSALFLAYLILSLYSLYPSKEFRAARSSKLADAEGGEYQRPWEMTQVPQTPGTTGGMKSPTTPRTTAFNTLSGKGKAKGKGKAPAASNNGNGPLPLRHHISMGEETYKGPSET
ncbi:MAG: hypothetical protein Q9190_006984 [Brigantiaea leucoxantha]